MDTPRKLIVGYDLGEDYSQISCYSYKTFEPISICAKEGDEFCPIPTVLCVKNDTKSWLYGEDAAACASIGEGIIVKDLLKKLRTGEEVKIFGQSFSGITLMEKFLRKSLTLIKNYFPTEPITKLVITISGTDSVIVDGIYQALDLIGIEKDRAVVMSHTGAYLYYALNQDRALWINDVGLFDFNESGLYYYQISINRRMKPIIAGVTKRELTDNLNYSFLNQKDINVSYAFLNIANSLLYKQIISTLYFTGKGFEGEWAAETIKSLCTGRRVFLGQNLYTKGACYAAKELSGDQKFGDYILLNDEMIKSSVGVCVYSDATIKEVLLTEAAAHWYEVNSSIEVIPEGCAELEIIIKNIMTKEVIREKLVLNHLPNRPDRVTRLEINLTFINKTTAKIMVKDLGFGDLYPETGNAWEFSIEIE